MKSLRSLLRKEAKFEEEKEHLEFIIHDCGNDEVIPELREVNRKIAKVEKKIIIALNLELKRRLKSMEMKILTGGRNQGKTTMLNENTIARISDMGEGRKLQLLLEDDGDIIVSIMPVTHVFTRSSVQFCLRETRSKRTILALHELRKAMIEDEIENPHEHYMMPKG